MAVRAGADDLEGVLDIADDALALEDGGHGVDAMGRPVREIGEGALANAVALTEGLAEQDGGRRRAVGDSLDVHGHI